MGNNKSVQGVGWKFPPTFTLRSRTVMMVSEEEDIRESLEILFSTRKGERNMLPEYGCDLYKVSFDSINENSISHLQNIIRDAIDKFESRITLIKIEVDTDKRLEGLVTILIYFTINTTGQSINMVYPYYVAV